MKQEKIRFYGVVCGKEGIQPDPSKVSALKQMSSPTRLQELQTFLGLANYMSLFIPNLSALTAPLRELLKANYQFHWSPGHQEAYRKVKDSVNYEVTLAFFDPRKEIILQADASLKGLGATPIQENKPVAFTSKSLTDVETRYTNIKRELLPIVYGCERQELQKFYHDRSARQLPEHAPGQKVTIQDPATLKWKPAEVEARLTAVPRSYMVTTPAGEKLRRTRTHIWEVPQSNQEVKLDLGGQIVSHAPSNAADGIEDTPGNQVLTDPGVLIVVSFLWTLFLFLIRRSGM